MNLPLVSSPLPQPETEFNRDLARLEPLSRAIRKATRRLAPFLMLMYIVSFLDRSNISFAKQALQSSQGIGEQVYALAAGLFFLGYSSCGFPSNLVLHRTGARRWITFIMIAWGIVSMANMLIVGPRSFYALRLLLGITEAGFFPGIILYTTYWFPAHIRGRILGLFYLGVPFSLILGGPLSGFLLEFHWLLQGWQWMFFVEGFLAVIVGVFAWTYLDNRPSEARWLDAAERESLTDALLREESMRRVAGPSRLLPMLRDLRVLHLLLIYTLIQASTYGAIFYLPSEISSLIHRPAGLVVGALSSVPWIVTAVAVYLLPSIADRHRNHRLLAALTLAASGIASFAFPTCGPFFGLIALSIAVAGFIAVQPLFWTFPTSYLADRAAAGGIALIGVGNLGGFLAPNIKVLADGYFASTHAGLYVLAGLTILNAALIALVRMPQHGDPHVRPN